MCKLLSDINKKLNCLDHYIGILNILHTIPKVRVKKKDAALFLMIIKDFQPFSIVNGEGFSRLNNVLDPRYRLPSKTTLKHILTGN